MPLNSKAEKIADKARDLPEFNNFSLSGIKEKVSNILDMIGKVEGIFSTYTIHNISHVDAMLEMLDWLIPPSTQEKMTTIDWLTIVLSIYLHDLGMFVTTEEYNLRMKNAKFKNFLERLKNDADYDEYIARTEKMNSDEKDRFFYQEFVRMQHASRIREWITGRHSSHWGETIKPIADEIAKMMADLPSRFIEHLAIVCDSHHKDDLDNTERYPLCQRYGNKSEELANIQYAAIMLRTADLLHMTKDRTPSVMYKTIRLSDPKGVESWKKQSGTFSVNMSCRDFDPNDVDSHFIIVGADFTEEEPFFALTEYLAYSNEQIKQSKRWVDSSQNKPDGKYYSFPWHKVEGDILVEGNEPFKMNFKLDRGKLLNLLVGHTIYNDPTVAVRELLQNAIDAVRFQNHLDKREVGGQRDKIEPEMGQVTVNWNPDNRELIVEDNGIGMNLDIIKYHLMRVGKSFYDSPEFYTEYSDYTPISQFGIGILTCFMISDDIEIITCQKDGGYRIRMSSVEADYLLKKLENGHLSLKGLEPHGTRVKVRLRSTIDVEKRSILDIVRHWIILPACKVFYSEKGQELQPIGFNEPSEALNNFLIENRKLDEDSYEIINSTHNENSESYELAFTVRKQFTPELNFLEDDAESTSFESLPITCIEGIRADNVIPGFKNLDVILSVRGNRKFRTTVSRTNLERDIEYTKVGYICARLLFKHVESETKRISEQKGRPLSQASTAGLWIYGTLIKNSEHIMEECLENQYFKLPLIIIEKLDNVDDEIKTYRDMISQEQLNKLDEFWTIESRLVDYLGILSRDLGKELSLNDFLGTLAPEFRDRRITPVVSDADQFKHFLLHSHTIDKVEFSRKRQQTLIKWRLKMDSRNDSNNIFDLIDVNLSTKLNKILDDRFRSYGVRFNHMMSSDTYYNTCYYAIAPLEGDIDNICGIRTRIVTILEPKSKAAEIWEILIEAILKISKDQKLDDLSNLFEACIIFNIYSKRRYTGFSFDEIPIYEKWRISVVQINILLKEIGIDMQIDDDLKDLFNNKIIFDATKYWMDWKK